MAESIGRLLECSICLEQMVVPKILPCFHTFCLACLCKIESKENKLQCPECRKVHNLPNDGAKGFNNNYRLATLIDDLHTVPSAPPLELECQHQVCPQKPETMSQHSDSFWEDNSEQIPNDDGKVYAYGPGLTHGVCGDSSNFVICTKGAGTGDLALDIEGPSKANITSIDTKDGKVHVFFLPTAPGEYKISARFAGDHIEGSPFTCKVGSKR